MMKTLKNKLKPNKIVLAIGVIGVGIVLILALVIALFGFKEGPGETQNYSGSGFESVKKAITDQGDGIKINSIDLSGKNRKIITANSWKVCTQSIEPGKKLNIDEITLGVVMAEELCPNEIFEEEENYFEDIVKSKKELESNSAFEQNETKEGEYILSEEEIKNFQGNYGGR